VLSTKKGDAGHQIEVLPSTMGNLLLRFSLDVLGRLRMSEAWEALNKTLKALDLAALSFVSDGPNWKLDGN
jgi:hypothetical protein